MRVPHLCAAIVALSFVPVLAVAGDTEWRRYVIASTGTSVDMPVSIFTVDAGPPEGGTGRRFFTDDRRADLTVQSVPNAQNDSPASFLAKMRPPAGIIYRRITSDFFVVSSIRKERIWYNRCNRGNGTLNCVMINYPVSEKRQWDDVVTRISHTLRS
ncbi:hypothetical protein [Bradyrhizobium murdochi]|uniref:hypothetical protein n=1 Tax=Bradyrhizobium murdochi TaxID=1038859 RepID=UPI00040FC579|nr:hypothetical protein [Bradyrhizobium murdochi]